MKNRKKLVLSSFILVWVFVVAGLGVWLNIRQNRANDILKQVQWYDPEGKEFTIGTAEELLDVSALSKYFDFKGQTIYLDADIILNEGDASKWAEQVPAKVWSPITKFAGVFDGKGHTISGIYAYGVNSSVGLFTETQAACTIKNLRLENSYILGLNDGGTGSIIGCGSGTLDTVYSNAIVEGQSDNVGGLIGYIKAGKTNLVQNCWFDGEVNATEGTSSYVGGLVGKVLSNTSLCKIMDCLNTANVNATGEYVGGFIGAIVGETNMWLTDCLSTGDVKGAEGAKTVAMAVGAVFKQVSLTTKTCWVQEGSYAGRFGNASGEIKGILASAPKEQLRGFDAYTYTTLEFDRAWAVQENDIPMLKCFAKNDPDLSGVVKLLDVSWYDEKSAELHIKNLAQLNGFNFLSQVYNYSGQKVVLDNDITINEGKAKDWAKNAPDYEWTPVGRYVDEEGKTKGQTFAGTFDGNGHKISGMYINIDSTKAFAVGFFGKVIGKIQNLSIVNSYIGGTTGGNVGTFAASFAGGIAENLYSNAIIDIDANHVGGIVGRDESEATFVNCWFDGSVKGKERVGGIMGSMNNNTTLTIQHCLNSGSVHSTSYYAGGLSGLLSNGVAIVEDSLNVGKITTDKAERWCGGIAGVVNGKEGIGIKATIKNTYSLITANKLAYGVNGPERKIIGAGGILLTENELNGNNAYQFTNLDFKEYWSVVRGKSPVLKTFATGTMKASGSKLADMNWYTVDGKSFKINTAAQLRGLAILSRTNTFEGQTIELTQDIKLPENLSWEPIGKHVDGAKNTVGQIFKGTFKGNGHTIEDLNIDLGENAVAYGLFGQVAGTIQDLRLKDGKISGKAVSAIGSLAGSLVGKATISNVYSNVTIDVDANYVGGIVGKNEGKTKNVITNCWNDGLVSGAQRVAGIVGYSAKNSELEITHCLNTKEITSASEQYVAGICGLADQCKIAISDSLNTGKIATSSGKALGYSAAIVGGIKGTEEALGTATLENVYYLTSSCKDGAKVLQDGNGGKYVTVNGNGVIGLLDRELNDKNAYAYTTLDYAKYWTAVKNATPVLTALAENAEAVTGTSLVDTNWYDVVGKEFDIDTVEELRGFALLSRTHDFEGQTINLVKNIELSEEMNWEPIGKHRDADENTVGQIFAGTFNGNGHTISGLTMELTGKEVAYGLFGQVTGTVKELVLKDAYIGGKATSAIGTVAGDLLGGAIISDITCENAEIDIVASYVGGIVGKNSGTAANTVKDSEFAGSISGTSAVGGIVGQAIGNSTIDIVNCENKAAVSATGANVGGICGYALEGATVSMEMCNNSGDVKAGENYAGGMLGFANKNALVKIANCWNSGAVYGKERVAGILGYSAENSELEITHCLNTGVITSASEHYVAGICGLADRGTLTIKDSLNTGKIATSSGKALGYSAAIVGGIKGTEEALGTATLENVYYLTSSCKDGAKVLQDGNGGKYVTVNGNGVIGLLDGELNDKNAYAYTTLDYSKYWTAVKDAKPVLTTFAGSAEKVTGTSLVDTNWYDVSEREFDIDTAEELRGFALLSRTHNFQGQTINLVKDIKLVEGMDCEPIGSHVIDKENNVELTVGKTFEGTFDGCNHKITNLNINVNNENAKFYGLFGKVTGTIKNLELEDVTIRGTASNRVGAVAGSLAGGQLLNVYANSNINITASCVGGLVGIVEGEESSITNCWSTGSVSGKESVGGIIGQVSKKVTISHCLNDASITSTVNYAGGLVGRCYDDEITIYDCLNAGSVQTTGANSNIGALIGSTKNTVPLTLKEVYYKDLGIKYVVGTPHADSVIEAVGGVSEENLKGSKALDNTTLNFNDYWTAVTGSYPVLTTFDSNVEETLDNSKNKNDISWYTSEGNDGSASKPYVVDSKEDLVGLAFLSKTYDFAGKTIQLGADITLNDTTGTEWYNNATSWTPIGKAKVFAGTFDGNNKEIKGLYINASSGSTYGLFGKLAGSVKNLKLKDFHIDATSSNYVGSVAGEMRNGNLTNVTASNVVVNANAATGGLVGILTRGYADNKISDCEVSGEVTGKGQVGGLVGAVQEKKDTTSAAQLKIDNSKSDVTVTSSGAHTGGLCGKAGASTVVYISNCWNNGTVTGTERVAGLVGTADTNSDVDILHSLNSQSVTGSSNYVGGLVGYANGCSLDITDSLNIGTINLTTGNTTEHYGAIIGAMNGSQDSQVTATFNSVYYMSSSSSKGANVLASAEAYVTVNGIGVSAVEEAELKGEEALYNTTLNFNDYWTAVTGSYPVLTTFDSNVEGTLDNLKNKNDISWYTSEGNDGSESKPYVVNTKEDLVGLAFLSKTYDFAGKTIQLGADIDLTGINWEPIGKHVDAAKNTVGQIFAGTFNGNGHTISGLTIELTGNEVAYGLFGQVTGTVKELVLKDAYISGRATSAIGAVAGDLLGGATVSGITCKDVQINTTANHVGGIVGKNSGTTKNIIQNSYFEGSVSQSECSGNTGVGGILGYVDKGSILDVLNSKVEGTIESASNTRAVGGVIGWAHESSNLTIKGCINGASLSGGYYTGGICGLANKNTIAITDSINAGGITGGATHKGSVVGRFNTATCKPTLSNVYYLKVDSLDAYNNNGATITGTAIPLETIKGDLNWYDVTKTGTTYMLNDENDLWGFALVSRINDFAGKTITLGENITLNDTTINDWHTTATSWKPIGYHVIDVVNRADVSIGKTFAGTFDGAGNTIEGLYINTNTTATNIKEIGLFGRVSGTIQNLKLHNSMIEGGKSNNQKIGTIAGALKAGNLKNVHSTNATINVIAVHVGGLVGALEDTTGTLDRCRFSGSVNLLAGNQNAGGLVGFVSKSSINIYHCLNEGNIAAVNGKIIGGLCGRMTQSNAIIQDTLNTGNVSTDVTDFDGSMFGQLSGNTSKPGSVQFTNVYYQKYHNDQPVSGDTYANLQMDTTKCIVVDLDGVKSLISNNQLNSDYWTTVNNMPVPKDDLVTQ